MGSEKERKREKKGGGGRGNIEVNGYPRRKRAFSFLVTPCLADSLINSVVYAKLDAFMVR